MMDWLLNRLSSSKTQGISMSDLVAYRFDVLPANHIRLLVLEPARFSHQLVCRLITHRFWIYPSMLLCLIHGVTPTDEQTLSAMDQRYPSQRIFVRRSALSDTEKIPPFFGLIRSVLTRRISRSAGYRSLICDKSTAKLYKF
jgi:hypothetical protein